MTEDDYLSQGAYRIQPADPLRGTIRVPGDKSISHRAVMLGALAEGDTIINGFLESEDCVATLNAFRQMGIEHERTADGLVIHGQDCAACANRTACSIWAIPVRVRACSWAFLPGRILPPR